MLDRLVFDLTSHYGVLSGEAGNTNRFKSLVCLTIIGLTTSSTISMHAKMTHAVCRNSEGCDTPKIVEQKQKVQTISKMYFDIVEQLEIG